MKSPSGWIGYTGDLRRHGYSKWRTEAFASKLAALRPALLIVEGTALGSDPPVEEPEVHQAALEVVRQEAGLVIADFTARNIERLRTFWEIARELGRRLVVTTKDAYLLAQMHLVDPAIPSPAAEGLAVLQAPRAKTDAWEEEVLGEFSPQAIGAAAIRRAPESYLLCLSYWDLGAVVDLDPRGGTYIYSASEAHDEEQAIDHRRLAHWLDYFGLTKVGGLPGAERGPFHASGHIDGAGMEWLIETIAPAKILPVHTQQLGWFEERWPEKVIRARYAEPVVFD